MQPLKPFKNKRFGVKSQSNVWLAKGRKISDTALKYVD